jgi:hypothetical protein
MSYNLKKFNLFLQNASEKITCDKECQKKKEAEKLKQNYTNAQTNYVSAPYQVQFAEEKYVTFTEGSTAYNELNDKKLQNEAKEETKIFKENFDEMSQRIQSQIDTYSGILINFNNVFDLYTKYKNENIKLEKDLKDSTNDILTNERKTFYEDQQIDSLKFYYYYVLLIIYCICVICFFVFNFLFPSQSSWKVRLAAFIGLIILPFISKWLLGGIIYILYEIYNLLPKNVYKK